VTARGKDLRARRSARVVAALFATGVVLAFAPASASATGFQIHDLQPISPPDPFPHGCGTGETPQLGTEVEPSIAVNPVDPHPRACAGGFRCGSAFVRVTR
jgi:hypothetical protein